MLKGNDTCQYLCSSKIPDAKFVNERIRENYAINWLIDGLPAASNKHDTKTNTDFYSIGFNLGVVSNNIDPPVPVFNNHYDIKIDYHKQDEDKYRVVGVIVTPQR